MNDRDRELAEFFDEERRRDMAEAPTFAELTATLVPGPGALENPEAVKSPAARRRWTWLVGVLAAAAVLLAAVLVSHRVGPKPDPADLDGACDSALAALQEQASDARMELSTDTLLRD